MARPSSYPVEPRKRTVRTAAEARGDYPNRAGRAPGGRPVAGIGSAETLRNWVKRDEVDSGTRPGTTTEKSAQISAPGGHGTLVPRNGLAVRRTPLALSPRSAFRP
jgi:transposase